MKTHFYSLIVIVLLLYNILIHFKIPLLIYSLFGYFLRKHLPFVLFCLCNYVSMFICTHSTLATPVLLFFLKCTIHIKLILVVVVMILIMIERYSFWLCSHRLSDTKAWQSLYGSGLLCWTLTRRMLSVLDLKFEPLVLFCSFHTDALFFLPYLRCGAIYVVLLF